MITPTSSIRVAINDARVTDLACSRRSAKFEATGHTARHFPYMYRNTFGGEMDPRQLAVGIFATLLLVPVTVAAVPLDLLAMPFRRECDFTLTVDGKLEEWAGRAMPHLAVGLEGRNLLSKGVEGIRAPQVFRAEAQATADADARFSISIKGHVGGSKEFVVVFSVAGRPANSLTLRKSGGVFLLEEQDPGFGTGVHENETREIRPGKKVKG